MFKAGLTIHLALLATTIAHAASDSVQSPAGARLLGGAFRYFADATAFKECKTRKEVPVASDGAFLDLQAAYAITRPAPAAPLYVTVEGRIGERPGMEGLVRPTLVMKRFFAVWPGMTCAGVGRNAPLVGTDWKSVLLNGETLQPVEGSKVARPGLYKGERREAYATGAATGWSANSRRQRIGA